MTYKYSKLNVPKVLYHGTYKPLLQEIKKFGLDAARGIKNWSESKNVIYLATDPNIAEAYAETSETVPDQWLDQIIILEINTDKLNRNKLRIDTNILDQQEDPHSFEYNGIIPASNIKIQI